VVVLPGETETVPEVALPVLKFVPVQDVAFVEDHVSAEELPETMDVGLAEIGTVATWSWWWVTAPLWIPLAFGVSIFLILFIVGIFIAVKK
jgi:hypothetical protein